MEESRVQKGLKTTPGIISHSTSDTFLFQRPLLAPLLSLKASTPLPPLHISISLLWRNSPHFLQPWTSLSYSTSVNHIVQWLAQGLSTESISNSSNRFGDKSFLEMGYKKFNLFLGYLEVLIKKLVNIQHKIQQQRGGFGNTTHAYIFYGKISRDNDTIQLKLGHIFNSNPYYLLYLCRWGLQVSKGGVGT